MSVLDDLGFQATERASGVRHPPSRHAGSRSTVRWNV